MVERLCLMSPYVSPCLGTTFILKYLFKDIFIVGLNDRDAACLQGKGKICLLFRIIKLISLLGQTLGRFSGIPYIRRIS